MVHLSNRSVSFSGKSFAGQDKVLAFNIVLSPTIKGSRGVFSKR
eukprot:COSAG06_NODE_1424_length_9498_cov_12.066816_2_plen_44_part_00